jgi:hypothetical protein
VFCTTCTYVHYVSIYNMCVRPRLMWYKIYTPYYALYMHYSIMRTGESALLAPPFFISAVRLCDPRLRRSYAAPSRPSRSPAPLHPLAPTAHSKTHLRDNITLNRSLIPPPHHPHVRLECEAPGAPDIMLC